MFRANLYALVSFCLLVAGAQALAANIPSPPGAGERCPTCGMFVAPFPTWIASLKFPDGKVEYFDGPRDMLLRYFAKGGKTSGAEAFVTEYYTTAPISARAAYFVTGSDVVGPMGVEFVPLASKEEAMTFKEEHGGKRVFAFGEITEAIVKAEE